MSFKNKSLRESTKISTNMSIYIENNYLVIKSDIDISKHKILGITKALNPENYDTNVYFVNIDDKEHRAYLFKDNDIKGLILETINHSEITFFYERRESN